MNNGGNMVENPFGSKVPAEASGAGAMAMAQREIAEVQAGLVIAQRYPRDPRECMDRILNACSRVSLAEKAEYQYARGGNDISGPSIRLAEELARGWKNVWSGIIELSRANGVSECLAYCWDLESNYRDEKRFQVKHWRDKKNGQGYALTDERDIYELIANQGARRKRSCILAVIPGDVVEAAERQCALTLKTKIEATPEVVARMVKKFEPYGVTKEHIEKRIQRRLDSITPALLLSLGKIYNSLEDGMSTAAEWFDVQKPANGNGGKSTSLSEITKTQGEPSKKQQGSDKGEKPESETNGESGPVTAAEVQAMIDKADDAKKLDEVLDLIRSMSAGEETDKLKQAALRKFREVMG